MHESVLHSLGLKNNIVWQINCPT